MIQRKIYSELVAPNTSPQGCSNQSHSRREILTLLPLLAVGCAATRLTPPATPVENTSAPASPASALMDQIVAYTIDTRSSLSPRSEVPAAVRLRDLVLYHGHACDGLMIASRGISLGLNGLFDGGAVDRTDMAAATNASVCYGDVLAYLTGTRHRYGSMVVDPNLGDEWILLQRATHRAVRVSLRPGVKPSALAGLESALRASACPPNLMDEVESLQHQFVQRVWSAPADDCFKIEAATFPYDAGKLRSDVSKRDCPLIERPRNSS